MYLAGLENVLEDATGYLNKRRHSLAIKDKFYGSMAESKKNIVYKVANNMEVTKDYYHTLTDASTELFMKLWKARDKRDRIVTNTTVAGGTAGAVTGAGGVLIVSAKALATTAGAATVAGTGSVAGTTATAAGTGVAAGVAATAAGTGVAAGTAATAVGTGAAAGAAATAAGTGTAATAAGTGAAAGAAATAAGTGAAAGTAIPALVTVFATVLGSVTIGLLGAIAISMIAKKIASANTLPELEEKTAEAIEEFKIEVARNKVQMTDRILDTIDNMFRMEVENVDRSFSEFRMSVNIEGNNVLKLEDRPGTIHGYLQQIKELERRPELNL